MSPYRAYSAFFVLIGAGGEGEWVLLWYTEQSWFSLACKHAEGTEHQRCTGRQPASVAVGTSSSLPARTQTRPHIVKHLKAFILMVKSCAGVGGGAGIGGGGRRLQVAQADSWVTWWLSALAFPPLCLRSPGLQHKHPVASRNVKAGGAVWKEAALLCPPASCPSRLNSRRPRLAEVQDGSHSCQGTWVMRLNSDRVR